MGIIVFLIIAPLVAALLQLVAKDYGLRKPLTYVSAAAIAVGTIVLTAAYLGQGAVYFDYESHAVSYVLLAIDVLLAIVVIRMSAIYKRFLPALLIIIQLIVVIAYEVSLAPHVKVSQALYIDTLSIVMALVVGIIGSSLAVYSLGYMKDHYAHHPEEKDRTPYFMFLVFAFLSAMFLFAFSNSLMWMFTAWEITTVASFLLIGYTKTEIAVKNSFTQIILNTIGGIAFIAAICLIGVFGIGEFSVFMDAARENAIATSIIMLPTALLVFAGMVKAAQLPFQSWLLGAMVAPTPVSALLHSSTMVKAGVFLVIKLSPLLGLHVAGTGIYNPAGILAMFVGGFSFLICSILAITQSNGKLVLAYSTIANLGLIVACAGVGTGAAVWAAIFLFIFHAVSKSLLFICVGTAEHNIGSRDIESMDGMFNRMPKLTRFMIIGICGMFVAPFGMLISKWAALESFVSSGNIVLIMLLVFGSAATFFFWVKWLAKLSRNVANPAGNDEGNVHVSEWIPIWLNGILTILIMLFIPLLSKAVVLPYLVATGYQIPAFLTNDTSMIIMVAMLVFLVLFVAIAAKSSPRGKIVSVYMAGENMGDDTHYRGSMQKPVEVTARNWYMEELIPENRVTVVANVMTIICIGVLLILGAFVSVNGIASIGGLF